MPEESTVDVVNNIVYVDHGHTEVETIQAPYSLHRSKHHCNDALKAENEIVMFVYACMCGWLGVCVLRVCVCVCACVCVCVRMRVYVYASYMSV